MALNSSGPISLGGATTGQSINLEVGAPATSTVSLNDTIVRTLAGVATGQIVVPTDFYGKSLSSGYFQIVTSPATPLQSFAYSDPASKTYYLKHNQSNPAVQVNQIIIRSDDSGNILFATRYTPSAAAWNIINIEMSSYNPNYLIANVRTTNSPPPSLNNASGTMVYYLNKTNGSIISQTLKYSNSTSGQSISNNALDFPGGNFAVNFDTPSRNTSGALFLNSSGVATGSRIYTVTPAPSAPPVGMRYFKKYSSTNFDGISDFPSGGYFMANVSDSGTVNFAKVFTYSNGLTVIPQSVSSGNTATDNNFRYFIFGNSSPATVDLAKFNRSTYNFDSSIRTPGIANSTTLFNSKLVQNTDSSGNFCLTRPSNVGTNTLNFMTSSLANPSAYVITSPTTPTATFYANFYMDGYLYIMGQYANNVIGVLKIKEDGSTLGSGITASVGGYDITLTQNPSGLISSTPFGSNTGTPVGMTGTISAVVSVPISFTNSTPAGTVTSSKTPV